MGQCSTLPTEGRSANASKRSDNASSVADSMSSTASHRHRQHRQSNSSRKSSCLQVQTHNLHGQPGRQPVSMYADNRHAVAAETNGQDWRDQRSSHAMRDDFNEAASMQMRVQLPPPPDIAVRTRCYRLNLDADILPPNGTFLGPFTDSPPPLTYSDSEDSSTATTPVEVAVKTARIFRGITVAKDGTILTQNARATRSNRGNKNKRGEKSRQATKIDKAKDLVEESIRTGKAPDSDDPAKMMSLVAVGEYDEMKHLVRDGAKKLREAAEKPDGVLLAINRPRGGVQAVSGTPPNVDRTTVWSPRKRGSPHHLTNFGSSKHGGTERPFGVGGSSSTKAKMATHTQMPPSSRGRTRDFSSRELPSQPSRRHVDERQRMQSKLESAVRHTANDCSNNTGGGNGNNNASDGDWTNLSFSRGFHSIWNCGGGVGGDETGTISPTRMVTARDGKLSPHAMPASTPTAVAYGQKPTFEGRENHVGQFRETGVTSRAN